MTQYHTEYMTVCFLLSGDPYKGAERTACVRATGGASGFNRIQIYMITPCGTSSGLFTFQVLGADLLTVKLLYHAERKM